MSKDPENNDFNKEANNFGLPEGYFQKSAGSILNKIEWLEEHKEFPSLAELKNSNSKGDGFIIPEDYFDRSESNLELIPLPELFRQKISERGNGLIVPDDYFGNTEVRELSKVLADENNELESFPELNSLKKVNSFTLKSNYFNGSEQKIISILGKEARVISLSRPKVWLSAIAATLTIVLGLWLYNQYFKTIGVKNCTTLACIEKTELIKAMDEEGLYQTIDTKKLEEKLNRKKMDNQKKDSDTNSKKISTEELLDES